MTLKGAAMSSIEEKQEAMEDCKTEILEIECLRQDVGEWIEDLFPPDIADGGFCLDRAMGYYFHDLQSILHKELVKYASRREYGSRSRMHFFDSIMVCPDEFAASQREQGGDE
jgi:hypothetical protein